MKIVLNGEELSKNDYTGAKGTQVEIRDSDEEGNKVTSVSQTYTLTGAAYDLVASVFISGLEGKTASMPVLIYDDSGCCEEDILLFEGRLVSDNVRWCHGVCSVDVIFEEYTTNTKQLDCIHSTLIYDNTLGFQSDISHPKMVYCIEMRPDLLQHIILSFGVILNIIFLILTPIVAALALLNGILQAIEDVINAIPGVNINITFDFDGDSSTNLLNEYQNMRDNVNSRIIGCGRKHPAPLVRNYIKNVCDICGVGFSSSILNQVSSDYYNTTMLNAPIAKGSISGANWIDLNNPIYTLATFLDALKPVFNARWELIDGVLHFERKDFFDTGEIFVSFESLKESQLVIGELCLEWRNDTRPAFSSFKYAPDPVDVAGNESILRFNDIVEWNSPYSSLQSGSKEVQLAFGTPRFRDDGVDEDILGFYDWAPGGLGATIQAYEGVLILEKHLCFNPKLLIWDGNTPGRTRKYNVPGFTEWPANENYNFPFMFNEVNAAPNTAYPTDHPNAGLYPRFYSIDNPKLTRDYGKSFEFTFLYNCESLSTVKNARYVHLPIGTDSPAVGRIRQITVNLDDKTITIQGEV